VSNSERLDAPQAESSKPPQLEAASPIAPEAAGGASPTLPAARARASAVDQIARFDTTERADVLLQMQATHGNRFVQRTVVEPMTRARQADAVQRTTREADEIRAGVAQASGYDLSAAQVKPNSALAATAGVEALTTGQEAHFAPGRFDPGSAHGAHVIAHEFAHVVQQGTGLSDAIAQGGRGALESDADAVAESALRGATRDAVQPLPAPARPVAQAFDPRYHRESTLEGMAGTGFSNDEMGQVYQANWERDFSQAHPALAAIVIAWKQVKMAASQGKLTDAEINNFDGSVSNVISMIPFRIGELSGSEAYGGYRYFEHMDNPTGDPNMAEETKKALLAVPKGESIPQYMVDSREYIKTSLFNAAQAYRGDMDGTSSSQTAKNFQKRSEELDKLVPRGKVAEGSPNSDVIAKESSQQAAGMPGGNVIVLPPQVITGTPQAGLPTSGPEFNAEVDKRFWNQTHYKVGQRLDPKLPEDQPYVKIWLQIRDQVQKERQGSVMTFPPDVITAKPSEGSVMTFPPDTITAKPPSGAQVGKDGSITFPPDTIKGKPPDGAQVGKDGSIIFPPDTINAKPSDGTGAGAAKQGKWGPQVADGMGRASHALEDFFAHSNFVEIAIGEVPKTESLATGTFGEVDKKHSLAHKLRAVADEIENEMPLVNRLTGRTDQNPDPSEVGTGSTAPPKETDVEPKGWGDALGWTGVKAIAMAAVPAVAGAVVGGIGGFFVGGPLGALAGATAGGIAGLRFGLKQAIKRVIGTPAGVAMLRRTAELLEEQTRKEAQPGSHTQMAKDQPGHEDNAFGRLRTIKFNLAQQLAAAADRMVLGSMRQVFDAPSAQTADTLLQDIYKQLNSLIAPPSDSHPLSAQIEAKRAEAVKALEDNKKEQQQ
jgi:hypothetical protein